jgi:hypothetical protein
MRWGDRGATHAVWLDFRAVFVRYLCGICAVFVRYLCGIQMYCCIPPGVSGLKSNWERGARNVKSNWLPNLFSLVGALQGMKVTTVASNQLGSALIRETLCARVEGFSRLKVYWLLVTLVTKNRKGIKTRANWGNREVTMGCTKSIENMWRPAKTLLGNRWLPCWGLCIGGTLQPTHIGAHVRVAILHLLAHMGFHATRSLAGRSRLALMARNPFTYDRDPGHPEDSEFGFGRGKFPDPNIDFTDNGIKSRIPIADPDHRDQMLTLAMVRRMDINDPNDQPSPYVAGNTDRYGAQPPLVRERRAPKYTRPKQTPPQRMKRSW